MAIGIEWSREKRTSSEALAPVLCCANVNRAACSSETMTVNLTTFSISGTSALSLHISFLIPKSPSPSYNSTVPASTEPELQQGEGGFVLSLCFPHRFVGIQVFPRDFAFGEFHYFASNIWLWPSFFSGIIPDSLKGYVAHLSHLFKCESISVEVFL